MSAYDWEDAHKPTFTGDTQPSQKTGLLAPNGKPIVRLPLQPGVTASHKPKYAIGET